MKKISVLLAVMMAVMTGCIIVPAGEYHRGYYEYHHYDRDYYDRYGDDHHGYRRDWGDHRYYGR